MKNIMLVFGTRPEAIKMAPLVKELQLNSDRFQLLVCVTGQHRKMLDQVLDLFDIKPDFDLDVMKNNQDLYDVTSRILIGMRDVLNTVKPDLVLVHGDTTTSMAAALAAFYQRIPVGHIEAGLRTRDIYSPWPEEMNRLLTARLASFHFSPTITSKDNLIAEGISNKLITVTGNTVIDSLYYVINKLNSDINISNEVISSIKNFGYNIDRLSLNKRLVLITGHRRENFGDGFKNILLALKSLSLKYPNVDFVYPMHLNPNVRNPIKQIFNEEIQENIFFIEPLDYLSFVHLLNYSTIILTDSGGIQEEAPGLKKPVLVMRNTTERPEAVIAGTVKLVGTNFDKIVNEVSRLLEDNVYYNSMSNSVNPYGDGFACKKIVDFIKNLPNR